MADGLRTSRRGGVHSHLCITSSLSSSSAPGQPRTKLAQKTPRGGARLRVYTVREPTGSGVNSWLLGSQEKFKDTAAQ